jgi:PAS domain S-box-containing protein
MVPGMDALILQTGIVAPLMLALIVQTAARRDQGRIQQYLLWLLLMILAWMIGMVIHLKGDPALAPISDLLLLLPACFMAPSFCLMMLEYARIDLFERRRGARLVVLAPFFVFLLGFATNHWHGLMAEPSESMMQFQARGAGPLYWAFQIWSNAAAAVGFAVCARLSFTAPTRKERARATLLWLAALVPLAVHSLFTFRVLPLSFPLTPSALGVTSLLVVLAIRRYRLFEVQPVARRDVIEASGDAVIVADVEELVVDLNPAAAALLGAPREALCGEPLASVLARLGRVEPAHVFDQLLEAVRSGAPSRSHEIEMRDGSILEANTGIPHDTRGKRAGSFVVLRDRSRERRAQRLLHQSQKLESVGILAAGVAHEVNNPLAFVRANLAHLQHIANVVEDLRELLPKETAEELNGMTEVVDESITGLERIRDIVQGLLRFSRPPSGRIQVRDLNAVVAEAARFASLDRGARVRLELQLGRDLPAVLASPDQLVQVLLNLFLNAQHALVDRAGARIVVSTAVADGGVEIRVADNGPGVPEPIRDKIFDPFFTTSAPNHGTGLGLSIAFDIVREHGGSLELTNPADGGACFVVRLPASADDALRDAG